MQATIKKNLLLFFFMLMTLLGLVALFNYKYDPYDLYQQPVKLRPNYLRNYSYLTKSVRIIRDKPDSIIIGSSTVESGFALPGSTANFDHVNYAEEEKQLLSKLPHDEKIFNGGINGGTLYDMYELLRHAYANNHHLKHVVIALEWHLFTNERPPSGHLLEPISLRKRFVPLPLYVENLFSFATTKDAYQVLLAKHPLPAFFTSRPIAVDTQSPVISDSVVDFYSSEPLIPCKDSLSIAILLTSIYYLSDVYRDLQIKGESSVLNPEAFAYLKKIVSFAHEKNIQLDVYISPQHATHWITAERFGLGRYVDKWLIEVANITPFWDLSGLIDFSRDANSYFAGDDRHIIYKAGELVLPALLQKNTSPYVKYVTRDNVKSIVMYRHRLQHKWLSENKYQMSLFNHPKFPELRQLRGNIYRSIVHYNPIYRNYRIFEYLGQYVAIPAKYAPYDLNRFLLLDYPETLSSTSLPLLLREVVKVNA